MTFLFFIGITRLVLLALFSYLVLPTMYREICEQNDNLNKLRWYLFIFGLSYALTIGLSVAVIQCIILPKCLFLGLSDLFVINTLNMAISTVMMVLIYKKYY